MPDCSDGIGGGNRGLTQAHGAVGAGGTLIIAAGTYDGNQLGGTGASFITAYANTTIRAATVADGDISKVGSVILDGQGATAHVLDVRHANTTVSHIDFRIPASPYAAFFTRVNGTFLNNCTFTLGRGSVNALGIDSNCPSACTSTINSSSFYGVKYLGSSSNYNHTPAFNYCIIGAGNILNYNASAVFNNCIFWAETSSVMATTSSQSQTVTWNNCIFFGNSAGSTTNAILERKDGHSQTWVVNNGLLMGNPYQNDNYNFHNVTVNNSIRNKWPKFVSNPYPSAIAFVIDDSGNMDWFNDTVRPKLEAYGWKGGVAANATGSLSSGEWAKLKSLENNGHEILCHSRHHINLGNIAAAFSISRAGTTAGMANGVLSTSVPHSYTLSNYTMAQLRTQMQSDGYTVGTLTTNYDLIPATVLADFTPGTAIATPYNLAMDQTRTYNEEVLNSKQDMIAAGLNPQAFVPPGNQSSTALRTYLKNTAGFIGARGDAAQYQTLASLNIFDLPLRDFHFNFSTYSACTGGGETESNCIKRNVLSWLSKQAVEGSLYVFYTHGSIEWSSDQWDALLSAVYDSGVQVMTVTGLINYAKSYNPSGDLTTADGFTYNRTLVDQSNFNLSPDSPAIDQGVNAVWSGIANVKDYSGLPVTDASGNIVAPGGVVDIGPYEYVPGVYSLTALQKGTGSGTLSASGLSCNGNTCTGSYPSNTVVNIAATPDAGSTLSALAGCDSVSGNSCTVTMIGNRSVSINFSLINGFAITFTGSGTLSAPGLSCSGNTCTGSYAYGTVLTITAIPENGYVLTGWSGCDSVEGSNCIVTVRAGVSPVAVFDTGPVPVAVPAVGGIGLVFCIILGIGMICLKRE
jgi:hypothetical protein